MRTPFRFAVPNWFRAEAGAEEGTGRAAPLPRWRAVLRRALARHAPRVEPAAPAPRSHHPFQQETK